MKIWCGGHSLPIQFDCNYDDFLRFLGRGTCNHPLASSDPCSKRLKSLVIHFTSSASLPLSSPLIDCLPTHYSNEIPSIRYRFPFALISSAVALAFPSAWYALPFASCLSSLALLLASLAISLVLVFASSVFMPVVSLTLAAAFSGGSG